ncbi:MAG: hypothetical protein FWD32_01765 [Firmicutes bacterium]|nr:hypothetical protein [Bacillota bacterium]
MGLKSKLKHFGFGCLLFTGMCATTTVYADTMRKQKIGAYEGIHDAHDIKSIYLAQKELGTYNNNLIQNRNRFGIENGQPIIITYDNALSPEFVQSIVDTTENLNNVFQAINKGFVFDAMPATNQNYPNQIDVSLYPSSFFSTTQLAQVSKFKNGYYLSNAKIAVNSSVEKLSASGKTEVLLHEIMHVLGFEDDYTNYTTVMRHYDKSSGTPAKLTPEDVKLLYCLYGDIHDKKRTDDFKDFLATYQSNFFKLAADGLKQFQNITHAIEIQEQPLILQNQNQNLTFNINGTVDIKTTHQETNQEIVITKNYINANGVLFFVDTSPTLNKPAFSAIMAKEVGNSLTYIELKNSPDKENLFTQQILQNTQNNPPEK